MRKGLPPNNGRPLRWWCQDERRWGLLTVRRRRSTIRGGKPVGRMQHQDAHWWWFGGVAPATGARAVQRFPRRDAAQRQGFLKGVAARHPDTFPIRVLARRDAPTARALRVPEHVACIVLPARSPEVHAMERVWEDVRGKMAWKHFAHLDCLQDELDAVLVTSTAERLQSRCGYPYLVQAELAMVS